MNIKIVKVGSLETNCYILTKENNCLIIDPGADYEKIKNHLKNYNVSAILITHNHFDHIGALNEIKNNYNVPVYDKNNLEEKNYKIDNFDFDVIYTKGHTEDSITFYFKNDKVMFTGDFLFRNTIGRTDLPTGDYNEMMSSLGKIKKYDSSIIIYPGHGEESTLEYEFKYNNYLNN
jgi:glyoxylase-like metal-dependent hydrolase (beta-lactamase superfamily II)